MQDFLQDEKNQRVTNLPGGNQLIFRRVDPYGLIVPSLARGQLPSEYRDQTFTTYEVARKALEPWVNSQALPEPKPERPTIKYKTKE